MNQADRTTKIMDRVVRYERRRSRWWLIVFWGMLAVVTFGAATSLYSFVVLLRERDALSFFAIFEEDREVIKQIWVDALKYSWSEVPKHHLIRLVLILLVAIIIIIITRRERRRIRRARETTKAYEQEHKP